jgi:hypothetical protein
LRYFEAGSFQVPLTCPAALFYLLVPRSGKV